MFYKSQAKGAYTVAVMMDEYRVDHTLNSQKTSHNLPVRASYGMPILSAMCPATDLHKIPWHFPDFSMTISYFSMRNKTYYRCFVTASTVILRTIWEHAYLK